MRRKGEGCAGGRLFRASMHDEGYLEVDGDGEGLATLGLGHVAAVLPGRVLLQLLLRHEHDELAVQARLVVAQVVLMPKVVCTAPNCLLKELEALTPLGGMMIC